MPAKDAGEPVLAGLGTYVVIGAGGGIGRACSLALSEAGFAIVAVDADEAAAVACAGEIEHKGGRALPIAAEVGANMEPGSLLDEAGILGDLSGMLFGVAWEDHMPVFDMTVESLSRSLAVGPIAAFSLARETAQRIVGAGRTGSITFIGSLHGEFPFPGAIGYNVAQAALRHLCLSLARELTDLGVRANMVVPGWVRTKGEESWSTPAQLDDLGARMPLGRMAQPGDIAAAVRFLATAEYISGSVLRVDGALGLYSVQLPPMGDGVGEGDEDRL